MLKKISITIAVILAVLLVVALFRPSTVQVERSIVIRAKPEKIFDQINNFRKWSSWSPWEKIDPDMKRTYSGENSGIGAKYAWSGNREIGTGSMEITGSETGSRITLNLDFVEPFEGHNIVDFILKNRGDSTAVTWSIRCEQNYFARLIGIFVSMDSMIGDEFEKGLSDLKSVAER